ncbi:hypothetical protein E4U41_006043 [Claviceps citrina]|nr:hypothetical protein E4U41_006043 [Claviceps citrina]
MPRFGPVGPDIPTARRLIVRRAEDFGEWVASQRDSRGEEFSEVDELGAADSPYYSDDNIPLLRNTLNAQDIVQPTTRVQTWLETASDWDRECECVQQSPPPNDILDLETQAEQHREVRTDAEAALNLVNTILQRTEAADAPQSQATDSVHSDQGERLQFDECVDAPEDNGFDDDDDEISQYPAGNDAICDNHNSHSSEARSQHSQPQRQTPSPDAELLDSQQEGLRSGQEHDARDAWYDDNEPARRHVEDTTMEVKHETHPPKLSCFATALIIWEEQNNITRQGHRELVEVLQLVDNINQLKELPVRKDTLRKHLRRSLPLVALRKKTLQLDKSLLPSRSKLHEDLLVFDLRNVLETFLSSRSNIKKIYRGMAHLVNGEILEPWQARWWGESIRTTSGHHVYDSKGQPIWPSDFINWKCNESSCDIIHIGRVLYTGLDFRTSTLTRGEPIIEVQAAYLSTALPAHIAKQQKQAVFTSQHIWHRELVLVIDERTLILPTQVVDRIVQVHMDYEFDPTQNTSHPLSAAHTVRYFYDSKRQTFRPTRLTTPLRAEKEIKEFGREYLMTHFTDPKIISLPMFMFADAFGLFRNMYRSLEGIYLMPQYLTRDIRNRRSSVLPLTLGPFGSDLADVFEGLYHIRELDTGIEMMVQGEKQFVCSFVAAITGDMPSQQKLAGCLNHKAKKPCRYCLISSDERANLDFNIIEFGRYGEQLLLDAKQIRSQPSKTRQAAAGTALGMHTHWRLMDILG